MDRDGDDVVMAGGLSAVNNPYLFTGRRLDHEAGLYYYRTRFLAPEAGRFTSWDRIGVWGDPLAYGNGYTYGASNPINLRDHTEYEPYKITLKCIKACKCTEQS